MSGHPHGLVNAKQSDSRTFLSSHRALSVRLREFDRLTEAVVREVVALNANSGVPDQKPVVRRSPDRCLVQFGPVALTLAWPRHSLDSAADGEQLVIVWHGQIASPTGVASDQTTTACTPVRSATVVWEEVLTAVAVDEPSWVWRPSGTDIGGFRSTELAERCVEQLQSAARAGADAVLGAR
jgi:hypothetical protein